MSTISQSLTQRWETLSKAPGAFLLAVFVNRGGF